MVGGVEMNALLMQALRREAQNHFARRMATTAVSDWTPTERKQAECLGWKLPTFRPRREVNRGTMSWQVL